MKQVKLKLVLSFCFSLNLLLSVNACSSISTNSAEDAESSENSSETVSSAESPFSLEVLDLISTQDSTEISAEVTTKTDWDISKVTVNFTVFRGGEEKDSVVKLLTDFTASNQSSESATLPAGTVIPVRLQLATGEITDYQINLGWGEESEISRVRSLEVSDLKIFDMGPENSCSEEPCQHLYAVQALLVNAGRTRIASVKLALSLSNAEKPDATVAESVVVDLNPLDLPAGAEQIIRLKLGQSMWPEQAELMIPELKLISQN